MTREEVNVQISSGLTHDHFVVNKLQEVIQETNGINGTTTNTTNTMTHGTIADCMNREKQKLNDNQASTLSTIAILRRLPMYDSLVLVKRYRECLNGYTLEFPTSDPDAASKEHAECCRTKLVSVYLDEDDPIYQSQERIVKNNGLCQSNGEIVYVPMNGLLDRLDSYDQHGISVDSRVYAFAIGIRTAETFLTTSSMKEIQETPPI